MCRPPVVIELASADSIGSYVETEHDDVAVLEHVVLALDVQSIKIVVSLGEEIFHQCYQIGLMQQHLPGLT